MFDCVGEVQLWVNGKSVIEITGLILREDEALHIKGMHFQTFFGGKHLLRPSVIRLANCRSFVRQQIRMGIAKRPEGLVCGRLGSNHSVRRVSSLLKVSDLHWLRTICNYLFRHAHLHRHCHDPSRIWLSCTSTNLTRVSVWKIKLHRIRL